MSVGVIETRNPARPRETVSLVELVDRAVLSHQLDVALAMQPRWARQAPVRAKALMGWADAIERAADLPGLVSAEVGKPIGEARAEIARSVAILRYYSQAAYDSIGDMYPSPDGVSWLAVERSALGAVLVVTPWNFPVAIPIWKIGPALAYGNVAIFKPASASVGIAARLTELARDHLPADTLLFAPMRSTDANALIGDPRLSGVSFTGSESVGRRIVGRAVARGAVIQAEMGGQNPSIVLDDADLGAAAAQIAGAAMAYAGQKCTATSRVIVSKGVFDEFVHKLTEAVAGLSIGDPAEDTTIVGPLISESSRSDVESAVTAAQSRGAAVLAGASAPDLPGWYYLPSLLLVRDETDPFTQQEVFGPTAAILVAQDDDDAVRLANATRYGLVAAVYGRDLARAGHIARSIEAGMLRVNRPTTGVDFYAPFGGERASSYGPREQGRAAREFYTKTRTILTSPTA